MPTARFANATRQDLSERLGRDESTVYRPLKRYKQGGIEALLEVKTAPGKQALIPTTVMSQLHQRLAQAQGFKSYSQIQEWLSQECQIVVAYKTVHAHCTLQAKRQIESTPSTQCQGKA